MQHVLGDFEGLSLMALAGLVRHSLYRVSCFDRQMVKGATVPECPPLAKAKVLDHVALRDLQPTNLHGHLFPMAEAET